jgi:hypothetical protein
MAIWSGLSEFGCQHVNVCSLTCNDREFYSLDFISHPEGFNGEMDLGCWMLDAGCWRYDGGCSKIEDGRESS